MPFFRVYRSDSFDYLLHATFDMAILRSNSKINKSDLHIAEVETSFWCGVQNETEADLSEQKYGLDFISVENKYSMNFLTIV